VQRVYSATRLRERANPCPLNQGATDSPAQRGSVDLRGVGIWRQAARSMGLRALRLQDFIEARSVRAAEFAPDGAAPHLMPIRNYSCDSSVLLLPAALAYSALDS